MPICSNNNSSKQNQINLKDAIEKFRAEQEKSAKQKQAAEEMLKNQSKNLSEQYGISNVDIIKTLLFIFVSLFIGFLFNSAREQEKAMIHLQSEVSKLNTKVSELSSKINSDKADSKDSSTKKTKKLNNRNSISSEISNKVSGVTIHIVNNPNPNTNTQ
ncbi:MAG: hypothetical protein SFH39_08110 [Candidatus Magnetobacterium sp. LHC-1]|nr:hypothetical protein [Nitrospirota bacterium]